MIEDGYQSTGLHLQLGIDDYSKESASVTRSFARSRGADLIEFDLTEELGLGISSLSTLLRRVPCSGCGLNKRYLFNKIALDRNFTVVATGHNLDDESATLLGNVLHWQEDALVRQSPCLEQTHPKLVKKVKPLYSLTERETASYCLLKGIDYVERECPNAAGAHSLLYKAALNKIETESPGSKQQFLMGFLDRMKHQLQPTTPVSILECSNCGQPTTNRICAFCKLWKRTGRPTQYPSATDEATHHPNSLVQSPSKTANTINTSGTASKL